MRQVSDFRSPAPFVPRRRGFRKGLSKSLEKGSLGSFGMWQVCDFRSPAPSVPRRGGFREGLSKSLEKGSLVDFPHEID